MTSSPLPPMLCDTGALALRDAHATAGSTAGFAVAKAEAVSSNQTAVWASLPQYPDHRIEALRENGTWASIGDVGADGIFHNPAIPRSYQYSSTQVRLRVAGLDSTATFAAVVPVIIAVSSSLNANGTTAVSGTTSLAEGVVEALSDNVWKSIGDVKQGVFSNGEVPPSYRFNTNTMRLRVRSGQIVSEVVDSTLDFPHSRSMLFGHTDSAAGDQARFSWFLQKADYRPTGYFAPAQQLIEVWVTGNADDLTLLVGTQGLADRDNPDRQSENMRPTRLQRGRNLIADPFGGIIHIRNLAGQRGGSSRIVLGAAAVPIAFYIRGATSAQQWRQMLQKSTAPEVEWVGRHVVIAAFRSTALNFSAVDPAQVVDSHERVVELEAEVAGFDGSAPIHTRTNLLIYALEGSRLLVPHATTGYIALPYDGSGGYAEALVGGRAASYWVNLHEYGHHHQDRINSFDPFVEVSVNLYSLAVARVTPNEYTADLPGRWPAMRDWLRIRPEEKDFANAPDPQCIFEQLRLGLGAAFLPAWHRYVRADTGQLRRDLYGFIVSACTVSGFNLGEFFTDWGVLKSGHVDIWQAIRELNLPDPPIRLVDVQPYTDLAP